MTRTNYLQDPIAMWCACLHALVHRSINELMCRQFNYVTLMSLPTPLSRWFHKRLAHRYASAGVMQPYKIKLSTITRDSGLLHHSRCSANRKAMDAALSALEMRNVFLSVGCQEERNGREVVDVLYTLSAPPSFVSEVMAANARQRDHRMIMKTGTENIQGDGAMGRANLSPFATKHLSPPITPHRPA